MSSSTRYFNLNSHELTNASETDNEEGSKFTRKETFIHHNFLALRALREYCLGINGLHENVLSRLGGKLPYIMSTQRKITVAKHLYNRLPKHCHNGLPQDSGEETLENGQTREICSETVGGGERILQTVVTG
ncbi:hypothetical protein cyc_00211 [Cyclospora cayetanensis]|uniref:Uncharacterized protein n=1 Tax=Cyclospora cayetanensis TaxID=88456 RepID=A0A1D3D6C7_9EIME|nr:hypothetical protein cyc_00211 [Cyclospora cayetanensis]